MPSANESWEDVPSASLFDLDLNEPFVDPELALDGDDLWIFAAEEDFNGDSGDIWGFGGNLGDSDGLWVDALKSESGTGGMGIFGRVGPVIIGDGISWVEVETK